jgi:SSS family solute:Na+ symporter
MTQFLSFFAFTAFVAFFAAWQLRKDSLNTTDGYFL